MILSVANLRKAKNYLKKNGLKETFYASAERVYEKRHFKYAYEAPTEEELERQRSRVWEYAPKISLVVPAYETKPVFMEDLILSVADQTYANYELIIADASESRCVEKVVKELSKEYEHIRYHRLESNEGISENTNRGIELATGEYIALLDHDDLLTPDALFEVALCLEKAKGRQIEPTLVYTDEDKTNTYLEVFYEPNRKPPLDKELLLTNNYICHLSVYRSDVLKELKLRPEFDGAQDFDLVLRTLAWTEKRYQGKSHRYLCHVPKVLYHWRCHASSTAENPESKRYAYEAGKRAVEDYLCTQNIRAEVSHSRHLGFYRIAYPDGIWESRSGIGVVGGPVYGKKGLFGRKTIGGSMKEDGSVRYLGVPEHFSGLLHRAAMQQGAQAVDLRNILVREDLIPLFEETTGLNYAERGNISIKLTESEEKDIKEKSLAFCNKVRKKNIGILYDPQLDVANKGETGHERKGKRGYTEL